MKLYATVGLSVLSGALIGGAAIQALQAQAKPPVYHVAFQTVSDPDALNKEFVPIARETVRKNGGRPLAGSAPVMLEGTAPGGRVVVTQWESAEQAKAWFNSAEYQKAREIGNKYAKFTIMLVDGLASQPTQ